MPDSALYSEENLQKLAHTKRKWITRVPAPLAAAQAALADANPAAMEPLLEGYRDHVLGSTYGGVAQRWMLLSSEPRRPQAQRTVDKQRLQRRTAELKAFQHLCHTAFACEADAQQALTAFAHGWPVTAVPEVTIRALPRDRKRGRPAHGAPPDQGV